MFLKAYCSQYHGSETPTVDEFKSFVRLCKLGYTFANVTKLNIQLPYESLLFQFVTKAKFPRVTQMTLNYIHIGCMPEHSGVRTLTMNGCTFNGKRPRTRDRIFPFFNVEDLRINDGSTLSPQCSLPRLFQLRRILITDTSMSHPITRKKFPRLSHVELRGWATLEKFPNLHCPKVDTLIISHPEFFLVRRQNQFYFIVHLKLYMTNEYFDLVPIMNRLDESFFPRIETLELDFGVRRFELDLLFLAPLYTLQMLRINMLGTVYIHSLTNERFPNLRIIILNSDFVDLDALPAHDNLRMIIFPCGTDSSRLTDEKENWPRLTRIEHFANDLDLTLSDSDEDIPSGPSEGKDSTVVNEEMVLLNSRIEELAQAFDEREEKLREERLQAELKNEMDMEDEIKGL